MIDLTLSEMKEDLEFLFETKRVRDYDNNSIIAASRCFYEYESIMEDGITEKIVSTLIIGQLLKKNGNRIYNGQYKLVAEAVSEALRCENELDLTQEEKVEVINLAKSLKEDLPKMIIEYNPKVNW